MAEPVDSAAWTGDRKVPYRVRTIAEMDRDVALSRIDRATVDKRLALHRERRELRRLERGSDVPHWVERFEEVNGTGPFGPDTILKGPVPPATAFVAQFEDEPPIKFVGNQTPVEIPVGDAVNLPAHYANFKIEPIRYAIENGLNGFQFNINKYSVRALLKHDDNGREDLKKVIRYTIMFYKWANGDNDWWKAYSPEFVVALDKELNSGLRDKP